MLHSCGMKRTLTSSQCMETCHLMGLSITQYFEEIVFCMGFHSKFCCVHVTVSTLNVVLRGADLNASFQVELGKGM
jgi:hypothetical protein